MFLDEWFCGCGNPDDARRVLLDLLRFHPLHTAPGWRELENRLGAPDESEGWRSGLFYLICYTLDHFDLTEHGSSIGGSWLTAKGEAVRDALAREEADGFEALGEQHCVHGYDITDTSHSCGPSGASLIRVSQA